MTFTKAEANLMLAKWVSPYPSSSMGGGSIAETCAQDIWEKWQAGTDFFTSAEASIMLEDRLECWIAESPRRFGASNMQTFIDARQEPVAVEVRFSMPWIDAHVSAKTKRAAVALMALRLIAGETVSVEGVS